MASASNELLLKIQSMRKAFGDQVVLKDVSMDVHTGDDCAKAICLAVDQGFDTDCNGATVGSIIGMMKGENVLTEEWTKPLCGKLRTGIFGHDVVSIEDMVDLTMKHMA